MRFTLAITITVESPSREEAEKDVKLFLESLNREEVEIWNTKFINLRQQLPLVKTAEKT